MPLRFEGLVRAHGFMKTERPPEIWEADTEDVRLLPLLGEMLAAGIVGGSPLEELTLNVSNVVVLPDEDSDSAPAPPGRRDDSPTRCAGERQDASPPHGEFVAVTVRGQTDLGPDQVWHPGRPPSASLLLGRLSERLSEAGARYAYVRHLPPEGSVTVFLKRWP